ncbi:MAG: transposase family protein [Acidobacteria bacterium]|nr:transposase family protein [Acidobacteriota bacterium]
MPDPRIDRGKDHALINILMIANLATICGSEYFTDMAFGNANMIGSKHFSN